MVARRRLEREIQRRFTTTAAAAPVVAVIVRTAATTRRRWTAVGRRQLYHFYPVVDSRIRRRTIVI